VADPVDTTPAAAAPDAVPAPAEPRRPRTASVLTHQRPGQTEAALGSLRAAAEAAGVTLRFDVEETAKHQLVGTTS